ncbi:iron complex transport system substrate-binding protein [Paenibacillus endophyticus]|uniref:Iron complex transport system substrate-binding protein n=1 Tax=Paenibacillus endophyticus TaxID=1294268 RepID=A0A7W5C6G1_9BACL|nr:AraC family transcriptional regulator [Paenibacillus endophyticus]MBB3151918.1 iron complex transport system substrate-binding protein [Paenibacillus endophyticus]
MMIVEDHLILWNHVSLKIIDVKRTKLPVGEHSHTSQLSSSFLLYAIQGRARVLLDGKEHTVENGYVFHAGKGTVLTIMDITDPVEYYMIQYSASLPLPCSQDLLQLMKHTEPFDVQYGFAVGHAAPLLITLSQMEQGWSQPEAMAKLHVKSYFYQIICELMGQLQHQQQEDETPDIVLQAARYMDEHFAEPITADTLAKLLHSSPRTMQRMFNKRLDLGPIDYLVQVRIEKAKALLSRTNAGLKDIAEAVGYTDSYYFSRLFKRYTGVSPSAYRESMLQAKSAEPENNALTLGLVSACSEEMAWSVPLQVAIRRSQRTIIHLKGELLLQRQPQKIAVLDPQFMDHMLALGEQPAGSVMVTNDRNSFPEHMIENLRMIMPLGTLAAPDFEALRALAPDLIICTEFQMDIYENLSRLAPTIMLERNRDWRDTLRIIGRIMDKNREAEQVLQQYKHKINTLKSALAAKLHRQSVTFIRPKDNSIRLHTCAHRTAAILYKDLGLYPPKLALDRKRTSSILSLEGLPDLDADHYFMLTDNKYKAWSDEIQTTAAWKNLRAVQHHHVYHAEASIWIAYYGPIAMNQVVDQVAEVFLDAK